MKKNLAVPVSGSGTILEAMIRWDVPIHVVIADRKCRAIEIANVHGIHNVVLPRIFGSKFDRVAYTQAVSEILQKYETDLVAMAGFMTVFSGNIFDSFADRIINIHPSLLPAFKGERAVADALEFGVKVTGTTIHYATAELDNGPIIAQKAVEVLPGDTVETLHERIKTVERVLYPEVLLKLMGDH